MIIQLKFIFKKTIKIAYVYNNKNLKVNTENLENLIFNAFNFCLALIQVYLHPDFKHLVYFHNYINK